MGLTHHDGVSVYGSGLYYGGKNLEVSILPTGIARIDAGTFSRSGWKNLSVSTKLSTISYVCATPIMPATGLATMSSGFVSIVGATFSGHCIDFTMYTMISAPSGIGGGVTSCGTSNRICWIAVGANG